MPMLLRPVRPHIIGRDFIIRSTHFTNCQNVKPTTARIAHIPSAADRHEKNEISHIGLLSQYNLYPSFVHTLTDEKAIEPHTVHRHVSFIPEFGDILISISVTRTAPNKRKKRGKGLVSFPKQDIFTSISVHTRSNKRRKKFFFLRLKITLLRLKRIYTEKGRIYAA